MKILVLSDTHGNHSLSLQALEQAGDFDHLVHLGDNLVDACFLEELTGREILKVPGNCDHTQGLPRETVQIIGGKIFFITHGDLYHVKAGLEKLQRRASEAHADTVLYGHTHVASVQNSDGILFVNPGSLKRGITMPSFAIIFLENASLSAQIVPLHP